VNRRGWPGRRALAVSAPRVGLCGLLGSGNSGNEASMETVLTYLRDVHPNAIVDAMCGGASRVRANYGINAIPLLWYEKYENRTSGLKASTLKALGKGIDVFRTVSWVRRHDVVIVPGAGVLEATLPMRPWGFPYAMFLVCVSGRISGTKVALVSVGAALINQRAMRWMSNATARLAFYRSYRDVQSRDAMQQRGVDTSGDHVYPDLVFGIPTPPYDPGDVQTVGVGVMAYYGGNDDRRHAEQIHTSYVQKMTSFTRWLVDTGHKVRLFGGDNKFDDAVAQMILADLRDCRPDLDPGWVVAEPVSSFTELMRGMTSVSTVVATRYHNVMCALKLGKPTISLGYSPKFVSLMTDMGLAEFCQPAYSLDVDRLIEQFVDMESRHAQLRRVVAERNTSNTQDLNHQFAVLSALLFPAAGRARVVAEQHSDLT
jgi:polysaccharide pyruvyl transferase WcaK-like protein